MRQTNIIKFVLLFCLSAMINVFAQMTDVDYQKVSERYEHRGWELYAAEMSRKSHFLNYGDLQIVQRLKDLYRKIEVNFRNIALKDYDYLDLEIFYPELSFSNNQEVISYSSEFTKVFELFEIIEGWPDLFTALSEPKWNDSGECDGDILNNSDCGRVSKVNHVLLNLNFNRREKLNDLKESLLGEIDYASSINLGLNYDSNLVNIFQFLNFQKSISRLISSSFLNSGNDGPERKLLFVESMRSLISQVFREGEGRLVTNDLIEIELEPTECNLDCTFAYYKEMLVTTDPMSQDLVIDLLFDQKMITPLVEHYISLRTNTRRERFVADIYLFFKDIFDIDILDPELSSYQKDKVSSFLISMVNNLLIRADIESLRLAKKIEYFLKELE